MHCLCRFSAQMGAKMFESLQEIIETCREGRKQFWCAVMEDDCRENTISPQQSQKRMELTWVAMLEAAESYDAGLLSGSGLAGGSGGVMEQYARNKGQESLCGEFVTEVIAGALQMGESNACMKRIVAAPTAGACGVLPAVLVPCYRRKGKTQEEILEAMYVAAGIGQVIATRAFISGAAGGCQAEIGSASAMAAGALTALQGGNEEQIVHAAAMALKNLLGLVCDPVAGLVEVPCIKRNVIGAVNALSCADMALAGIVSRIPPDQVIDAMREIGEKMDSSLRETALGGLAATQEGQEILKRFSGDKK